MIIRTIIVDDEKLARKGIKLRLKDDKNFAIIDECSSGISAISSIQKNKPDLVFLDIQMPEINGFKVLENLTFDSFPIIVFITAFDKYALNAFEVNALDYLLKPIDDERFIEMLSRVKNRFLQNQSFQFTEKIKNMMEDISTDTKNSSNSKSEAVNKSKRIMVKSGGKISFIDVDEIIRIEAADDYLFLHTENKKHILRKRMKEIITELPADIFWQIHRSTIVNKNYALEIIQSGINDEYLVLTSGEKLKIGRSFKKDLHEALKIV